MTEHVTLITVSLVMCLELLTAVEKDESGILDSCKVALKIDEKNVSNIHGHFLYQ